MTNKGPKATAPSRRRRLGSGPRAKRRISPRLPPRRRNADAQSPCSKTSPKEGPRSAASTGGLIGPTMFPRRIASAAPSPERRSRNRTQRKRKEKVPPPSRGERRRRRDPGRVPTPALRAPQQEKARHKKQQTLVVHLPKPATNPLRRARRQKESRCPRTDKTKRRRGTNEAAYFS